MCSSEPFWSKVTDVGWWNLVFNFTTPCSQVKIASDGVSSKKVLFNIAFAFSYLKRILQAESAPFSKKVASASMVFGNPNDDKAANTG